MQLNDVRRLDTPASSTQIPLHRRSTSRRVSPLCVRSCRQRIHHHPSPTYDDPGLPIGDSDEDMLTEDDLPILPGDDDAAAGAPEQVYGPHKGKG